jgi:hypothetical protein
MNTNALQEGLQPCSQNIVPTDPILLPFGPAYHPERGRILRLTLIHWENHGRPIVLP